MADNSTAAVFASQWRNPTGFMSLLMIVGGPVIQAALAQVTGPPLAVICFSFGWISYAFSMIPALAGDGRLMPTPDFTCKVINLQSGYARSNRSWMIGRLLRDLEAQMPLKNEALCVRIYEAVPRRRGDILAPGRSPFWGLLAIATQLGIACIPIGLYRDWSTLMITGLGTLISLGTAALPQWRVEKLACRFGSDKRIAITAGNGQRHVIVILGDGNCLDLEDLAGGEGPRHARPWVRSGNFVRVRSAGSNVAKPVSKADLKRYMSSPNTTKEEAMENYIAGENLTAEVLTWRGLPLPFWLTRLCWTIFILLWAALLISVAGLKANTWFLVAVGAIGMLQNAIIAGKSRRTETRGLKLKSKAWLVGDKGMDVLMDLDSLVPGCGRALLKEFFPGDLDVSRDRGEKDWWDKKKEADKKEEDKKKARNKAAEEDEKAAIKKVDQDPGNEAGAGNEDAALEGLGIYDKERYALGNRGIRYDRETTVGLNLNSPSRGNRFGIKREGEDQEGLVAPTENQDV